MKRPSFQFYPGDWSANPNLKRCTFAEKGIWLEVMCLMHDQPDYGVLRWPLKEIAEAVKCKTADLHALIRKGVLKGDDKQLADPFIYIPRSGRKDGDPVTLVGTQAGPVWYSSRMVKDEYIRTIRGENTRFGDGNGASSKHSPKSPFGDGSSSSSSSSSSSEEKKKRPAPPTSETVARAGPEDPPDATPTPAGAICRSLRTAGIANVNPGHALLAALLEAGATEAEFLGAAPDAKDKRDPFAYVLGVVKGQREDAAKAAQSLLTGPLPTSPPPSAVTVQSKAAEQTAALLRADQEHRAEVARQRERRIAEQGKAA